MCRDVSITIINEILEDIHNNESVERIKEKCEEFMKKYDYEGLAISEDEIRKDRLEEYIRFFNISDICEYDIFEEPEIFYKVLEENLEEETWKRIQAFLKTGNILSEFHFS